MRRFMIAAMVGLALAAPCAAQQTEQHETRVVWQRVGGSGNPFVFSSSAVPRFDTMGGTRRLTRVALDVVFDWDATVAVQNPLNEVQAVEYTAWKHSCSVAMTGIDTLWLEPPGTPHGRLCAPPLGYASRDLALTEVLQGQWTPRSSPEDFPKFIGVEPIAFLDDGAGGGFDTFRYVETEPDCSGGRTDWGPFGFEVPLLRFELYFRFQYHWIFSASCPADLTTLSVPGTTLYGHPDGILDSHDFFYYLDQFAAGNLAVADLTTNARPSLPGFGVPNGAISNDDFFYFLLKYAEGC